MRSWHLGILAVGICCSGIAQQRAVVRATVAESLGYPPGARLLVIQAEDLGMAHSIDKANFEALEKGWVTTANVLVPGPWFPEVLHWSRNHENADLGIQLDLNSDWSSFRWRPLSSLQKGSGLTDSGGYFSASDYYVAQHATPAEVEGEVRAQVETAKRMGIPVSHLDNHMHTMLLSPALFQVYWKMGQEFGVPVMLPNRQVRERGVPKPDDGRIYSFGNVDIDLAALPVDSVLEIKPGLAQKDWLSAYEKTLDALPAGVYLLSVHLGFNDEELQAMTWDHPNWGAQWRQNDYDVISSSEFHKFLKDKGFILVGWKELRKAIPDQH